MDCPWIQIQDRLYLGAAQVPGHVRSHSCSQAFDTCFWPIPNSGFGRLIRHWGRLSSLQQSQNRTSFHKCPSHFWLFGGSTAAALSCICKVETTASEEAKGKRVTLLMVPNMKFPNHMTLKEIEVLRTHEVAAERLKEQAIMQAQEGEIKELLQRTRAEAAKLSSRTTSSHNYYARDKLAIKCDWSEWLRKHSNSWEFWGSVKWPNWDADLLRCCAHGDLCKDLRLFHEILQGAEALREAVTSAPINGSRDRVTFSSTWEQFVTQGVQLNHQCSLVKKYVM